MAENNAPQNLQDDDELSVEELEEAAGGIGSNSGCNGNCPCSSVGGQDELKAGTEI